MEVSKINSKEIIFALDIGTRSIIGTVGIVRDKKFHVVYESYIEHEERAMLDGQIHDINLVANGVSTIKSQLEKSLGFSLCNVSIAAAGRFLRTTMAKAEIQLEYDREIDKDIIRSLELTAVKNAEQEINKSTAGKLYCVGYSVKNYYLNDYIITNLLSHKGENASAEIIATFLPRSVVESLYAVMDKVQLNVVNLTLEPIAAMEAAIPKSLRLLNLALIDIGAGTSDIALSSKDSISAYGMVPTAGDEVTEVIAQNFLVDFNTAERIKKECSIKDTIKYCDVLGLENEIASEDVIRVIIPVIEKICEEIGRKVIELNGGKSPNAVFLVGGGAHTP
jgi:cell division protein FtsA